jgi:hypothetical protein
MISIQSTLPLIYHNNHPVAPLPSKTVINGGATKNELPELIKKHFRVIMYGYGSPNGLLTVGEFPVIGDLFVCYGNKR